MTDTIVDRLSGVSEGLAVKAPARVATTANITLSGLQTIDGVTVVADDRVLVWQQTDAAENGIYAASSGNWTRTADFDGNRDIVKGTRVFVTSGSTYIRQEFVVTSDDPVIDTDDIDFSQIASTGTTLSFTYGSGGDFATLAAAIAAVGAETYTDAAAITLTQVTGTITTASSSAIATIPAHLAPRLTIVGATTADTTITSSGIYSVSGSAGAWDVVINLTSVAGISVGQYANVEATPINGGLKWAFPASSVPDGGINLGYTTVSSTTVSCWSDSAASVASAPEGKISVGQMFHSLGQSWKVTAVSASPLGTFTVDAAAAPNIAVVQAYNYVTTKKTGTIGTASSPSTTITGSSSLFTTEANVGDLLIVKGEMRRITAIGGATSLTVSHNITIANGTEYSIIPIHELHNGCWEITAVDSINSRITVRNTSYSSDIPPPLNGIGGGSVTVLRSILKQTGTGDGIVIEGNARLKSIDKIAIVGQRASGAPIGINLLGSDSAGAASVVFGSDMGLNGWYYGVRNRGGRATIDYAYISNCYRGVYTYDGGQTESLYVRVSGCQEFGSFASQAQITDDGAYYAGNGNIGLYAASDASAHGDWRHCVANGELTDLYGAFLEGQGYIHSAPGRYLCNARSGVSAGRGSGGRLTGSVIAGNVLDGASAENSEIELATAWVSGNEGWGIRSTQSGTIANIAAITGNKLGGVFGNLGGSVNVDSSSITKNLVSGIDARNAVQVSAESSYVIGNTTDDYHAVIGGRINATSYSGSPVFNIAANTVVDGSLIRTGTILEPVGLHTHMFTTRTGVTRTTNGAGGGSAELTTSKIMLDTFNYDAATQEYVQWTWTPPKSWDRGVVYYQVGWSHAAATAFIVKYSLAGVAISDDDAHDVAFGTAVEVTDTGGTTSDLYITPLSAAVTVAGSPAVGDAVIFQLSRVAADAGDTLDVDARVGWWKLYYTTSAASDA